MFPAVQLDKRTATQARKGYPNAPSYGRTTRTQKDAEPAQDRLSHEGQLAPERAEAARSLVRRKRLRAHSGSAQRQTALCVARRTAISHWRNSSWHRPEQDPERFDRQDTKHGRPLRALRAGMGLSRSSYRDASRKGTRRQGQSASGGVSQAVPRIRHALRRAAQARFQAAWNFWPVERSVFDDELWLRSHHCGSVSGFHGEGLRLSWSQAGLLVPCRFDRARGSRGRVRRSHQSIDLGEI